jgi:hypothetical protein
MRRQRQLEGENAKLKRLVADQSLDKAMLQDVVSQPKASVVQQASALRPDWRRQLVDDVRST